MLLSGCNTRANRNIELIKRISDEVLGCYFSPAAAIAQGNLAYVANHGDLVILDVSDPLSPQCIASYKPQPLMEYSYGKMRNVRNVLDVVIDGHYAYLAANGLVVVDISDPGNPRELSTYDIDTFALDIKLRDQYAFVAAVSNGLLIFDVSDPAHPKLVSQGRFPDAASDGASVHVTAVDFVEQYVYVVVKGDYPYFIAIMDVSDPASPVTVRRYIPEHQPYDVVVQGQYAY
ncbi:MAG: hypothetical protein NUV75_00190, partial [Gallionella sp.]|nr:hypothetical protein [Gallionella sp.]